jgi:uncharacterized protein HemX
MEPDQLGEGPSFVANIAKTQRDQALACAVLALIISLAVILSNFGKAPAQYQQALAAIEQHKALIAQHTEILRANQLALTQNQAELERLRQAARSKHP